MNFGIDLYTSSHKALWDEFVRQSKNGTFLFLRDYMDYHADRFVDHSMLVSQDGRLVALLPANRVETSLVSHGGLTYGGFLVGLDVRSETMVDLFSAVLDDLRQRDIATLTYKTIPHIYHCAPAEEDRYCLFRNNAVLFRTDVLTVVDYRERIPYQDRRLRSLKRAAKAGLTVRETEDYGAFWPILSANLRERHQLDPVHSVEEIRLLADRFPNDIRLYGVYQEQTLLAGAVLYLTKQVCHVQYNAASPAGKSVAAQDILFDHLLERYRGSHRYFDFGVSTEDEGRYLSAGLVDYKEGFGGRCIVHDFFRINLR